MVCALAAIRDLRGVVVLLGSEARAASQRSTTHCWSTREGLELAAACQQMVVRAGGDLVCLLCI